MASERLNVILSLVAGQYKSEAKATASATGKIGDAASKTGTATGKMNDNMGRFIKLGAAAALGLVARQGLRAMQALGDLATEVEAWNRRAETVFGNQVDLAREWADAQNEAFGMGKQALLGLLAATGDLLVPMGFARDVALDLSEKLLLAANAGSEWTAGAVSVESAAERIRKAMLGEREGLIELGVKISEADLKQRLFETGKASLTGEALKQAQAEETLNLVYELSADALTAATDGTQGLLDARKELEATKADAQEKLAEETLPAQIAAYRGLAVVINRAGTIKKQFDGDLTSAEKNAASFADQLYTTETLSGEALEGISAFSAGVADAAVQTRRDTEAVVLFAESLGLTAEESANLATVLRTDAELFGLTADQGAVVADAMRDMAQEQNNAATAAADLAAGIGDASELENLGKVTEDAGDRARIAVEDFDELTKAHIRAADAAKAQLKAEDEIAERMRAAADPIYAAVSAWEDAAGAQAEFNAASDPTLEQALALAQANQDLEIALAGLRDQGDFEAGMNAIATSIGLPLSQLEELLTQAGLWNGQNFTATFTSNFVQNGYPPTGIGDGSLGDSYISGRAQGGPVMASSTYRVGENNRPELFMIPGDGGRVFSNSESRALMSALGSGGGGNLTINMQSVAPDVDAQRVAAMATVQRIMETV